MKRGVSRRLDAAPFGTGTGGPRAAMRLVIPLFRSHQKKLVAQRAPDALLWLIDELLRIHPSGLCTIRRHTREKRVRRRPWPRVVSPDNCFCMRMDGRCVGAAEAAVRRVRPVCRLPPSRTHTPRQRRRPLTLEDTGLGDDVMATEGTSSCCVSRKDSFHLKKKKKKLRYQWHEQKNVFKNVPCILNC